MLQSVYIFTCGLFIHFTTFLCLHFKSFFATDKREVFYINLFCYKTAQILSTLLSTDIKNTLIKRPLLVKGCALGSLC